MKVNVLIEPPTKEERFAVRITERRGLRFPVDVVDLARSLADFDEKRFPIQIDGLCLDLNIRNARAKIWVEQRLSPQRKRFTIAHEIGHVVIPWHQGSIIDNLDISDSEQTGLYYLMEGEANRFAAELLMPRSWVLGLIERCGHLQEVMRTISIAADVSPQAAAIRTLELGPAGYIVSATEDKLIVWSNKTGGTLTRLPRAGDHVESFQPRSLEPPQFFSIGRRVYFWWRELESASAPEPPLASWRAILEQIVAVTPSDKRHTIKQRLNAITAIPFSRLPKGSAVDDMYLVYLQAIVGMPADDHDLRNALHHPLFEDYALARMHERAAN